MAKLLRRRPTHCALCGLRIPADIANSNHPLFGTIDHLMPTAHGGLDVSSNRYPAHRHCNLAKGDAASHSLDRAVELRGQVTPYLKKIWRTVEYCDTFEKWAGKKGADSRVVEFNVPPKIKVSRGPNLREALRWEDDGGFCGEWSGNTRTSTV